MSKYRNQAPARLTDTTYIDFQEKQTYDFSMSETKVTIREIAAKAQVGIATVSRVLNQNPHTSQETREKVLEAIKELHYIPNPSATALAGNRKPNKRIGLVVPNFSIHYFYEIFENTYGNLQKSGYQLVILDYARKTSDFIRTIIEMKLSAVVFFSLDPTSTEVQFLKNRNIPILFADKDFPGENCIVCDNEEGGRLAARYLFLKGVRNPCIVEQAGDSSSNSERHKGFFDELQKLGYGKPKRFFADIAETDGYRIGKEISFQGKYDGVFVYCDEIAIGVLQAIREKQADIRIIGYDGLGITQAWGLSTISQGPHELGAVIVRAILSLLANRSKPQLHISLVPTLVDRDS